MFSAEDLTTWAVCTNCGPVVSLRGTAYSNSGDQDLIEALECDASVELTDKNILEIITAARTSWPSLGAVVLPHRAGRVLLSELAVAIAAFSPHRQEAFDAAQFCIDTLKKPVPMWKREIWRDGSGRCTDTRTILAVRTP